MRWNEWFEGFDFVNPMRKSLWSIEGVPMRVTWMNPMRMSLSKWMDSMRNEWSEVNRVKWVIWRIWLCEPYGNGSMVRRRWTLWKWLEWIQWESPYELRMSVPINLTWLISVRKSLCSVEWMSLSKWLRTTLWESPYGRLRVSLSKWLEWSQWESPYQNDQIWWDLS